jgi:hypothetical protein
VHEDRSVATIEKKIEAFQKLRNREVVDIANNILLFGVGIRRPAEDHMEDSGQGWYGQHKFFPVNVTVREKNFLTLSNGTHVIVEGDAARSPTFLPEVV